MTSPYFKSFRDPDETMELDGVTERQVELGDLTIGRQKLEPGWRWSTHVRPHVGGDWCQARHVGVMLSGRLGIRLRDGTTFELGPDDVFDIPPGHDGYVIGHEAVETIEWAGSRAFWGSRAGAHGRALATLMFTDLVDSTAIANRLGDGAWRTLLSEHFESARTQLERFNGREVKTTGDGLLATFEGLMRTRSWCPRRPALSRRPRVSGSRIAGSTRSRDSPATGICSPTPNRNGSEPVLAPGHPRS